jgi:Flp pilus assembly protein TadG
MRHRFGTPRPLVRLHRDERGLVIGFFVKILVVMMLVGLAVEEGGQVVVAQVKAEGAARDAAQAAADTYLSTRDARKARQSADQAAWEKDGEAKVTRVEIAADGLVTVTVREQAHTVVMHRIPFLRKFGDQTSSQTRSHS